VPYEHLCTCDHHHHHHHHHFNPGSREARTCNIWPIELDFSHTVSHSSVPSLFCNGHNFIFIYGWVIFSLTFHLLLGTSAVSTVFSIVKKAVINMCMWISLWICTKSVHKSGMVWSFLSQSSLLWLLGMDTLSDPMCISSNVICSDLRCFSFGLEQVLQRHMLTCSLHISRDLSLCCPFHLTNLFCESSLHWWLKFFDSGKLLGIAKLTTLLQPRI
jgi:hypothetical protein